MGSLKKRILEVVGKWKDPFFQFHLPQHCFIMYLQMMASSGLWRSGWWVTLISPQAGSCCTTPSGTWWDARMAGRTSWCHSGVFCCVRSPMGSWWSCVDIHLFSHGVLLLQYCFNFAAVPLIWSMLNCITIIVWYHASFIEPRQASYLRLDLWENDLKFSHQIGD